MKMLRANKVLSLKADALQGNKMVGYASGLGNLDSYADVIFPDAFGEPIVNDFLSTGFIADCHDWTKVVGMPLVAEVKGNLVHTEFEFHSTKDAQDLKTKCAERIDRGLAVGLSVGIGFFQDSTKNFPNGAALLDYADKNGQDMSLFDVETIKAHTGKCRAILHIDKWYEYSPITTATPANPNAWATGMKQQQETANVPLMDVALKGEFLGENVLGSMTMGAISRANDALFYGVFYDAIYYSEDPLADRRARIAGALGEYSSLVLRVFDAIMAEDSDSTGAESTEDALKAIKSYWSDPSVSTEGELPAGSPFEKQLKTTLAVVSSCTERARSLQEIRAKEGRTISAARRDQLTAQRSQLQSCLENLDTLLTEAAPPMDPAIAEKTLALRTKALHRKNQEREILAPEGNA